MVNEQLVNWLKESISKGYKADYLKNYLIKNGYSSSDVEDALKSLQATPPAMMPKKQWNAKLKEWESKELSKFRAWEEKEKTQLSAMHITRTRLWMLLGGIILLLVLAMVAIFMVSGSKALDSSAFFNMTDYYNKSITSCAISAFSAKDADSVISKLNICKNLTDEAIKNVSSLPAKKNDRNVSAAILYYNFTTHGIDLIALQAAVRTIDDVSLVLPVARQMLVITDNLIMLADIFISYNDTAFFKRYFILEDMERARATMVSGREKMVGEIVRLEAQAQNPSSTTSASSTSTTSSSFEDFPANPPAGGWAGATINEGASDSIPLNGRMYTIEVSSVTADSVKLAVNGMPTPYIPLMKVYALDDGTRIGPDGIFGKSVSVVIY